MRATINSMLAATALLVSSTAFCQKSVKPPKEKIYNALVSVSTQQRKIVGVLKEVDDSTIHLIFRDGTVRIHARVINSIVIKRKGNVGRGALLGSLTTMLVGGFVAFASSDNTCDSNPCIGESGPERVIAGAVLGAGIGALIGMGIGSAAKAKVDIGRRPEMFRRRAEWLSQYALPPGYVGY
ncbi:hypothetical protein WBG78_19085 [Chryseolinea sp. T2]|uniref:hypothetical protein n=1 Tax=Chryseolinea sp. T2 TaxID=3129255 RepID=UPI0030781DAC